MLPKLSHRMLTWRRVRLHPRGKMSETSSAVAASPLRVRYLVASAAALAVMIAAVLGPSLWLLNWVHVMAGTLWTGIDLFMGFVVGPVLRGLPIAARRGLMAGLIPRTLVLMPTLSIITSTS